MGKFDKEILEEETILESLFIANNCSTITYYVVAYSKSGNISCIFKYDGTKGKVLNWIYNGHTNKDAFAYYFGNTWDAKRDLYEIDPITYGILVKKVYGKDNPNRFERRVMINESYAKVFEIYLDKRIFTSDSKSNTELNITAIKNKTKI